MTKKLLTLLLLLSLNGFGQDYAYKRSLSAAAPGWYKIDLPVEIFAKIKPDMSDLRIIGFTAERDTVEAPYILRTSRGREEIQQVSFRTINRTRNKKGYFYTFERSGKTTINQITTEFKTEDFDWRIRLEGSADQRDWYTLTQDYRILSLKNNETAFKFTDIIFPESDFRFFRLFVPATGDPGLQSATLSRIIKGKSTFRSYPVTDLETHEERRARQTILEASLKQPVPVSYLKLTVTDSIDYYRPTTIKYLADSFKTDRGWKYRYRRLASGILDSRGENAFVFPAITTQRLKIIINNDDNPPLHTWKTEVRGYIYTLVTRVTQPADYYLYYGRANGKRPAYDIIRFAESIPDSLDALTPGEERLLVKKAVKSPALFENRYWLWLMLGLIIVLLGWFSIRMMRNA